VAVNGDNHVAVVDLKDLERHEPHFG